MAFAIGTTIYWTSGGTVYQGTVVDTPTQVASGGPNLRGGEPVYHVNNVLPANGAVTSTTVLVVRSIEARASA